MADHLDIPPLTDEQATMIQQMQAHYRHLEDHTLTDRDRADITATLSATEQRLQASRTRSWDAWWRDGRFQDRINQAKAS